MTDSMPIQFKSIPFMNYEKGIEIELRYGEFSGKYFNNGIIQPNFFRLLSIFETCDDIQLIETKSYTQTVYSIDDNSSFRNIANTWMKKTRIENIDLPNYFCRLSISKEDDTISIPCIDNYKKYEQHKKVWSFQHKNYTEVRFDLSIFTDTHKQKTFQVEIERIDKITPEKFWTLTKWTLCLIQNNRRLMTRFEQYKTIESFNSFFEHDIQQLEKKRSQHRPWKFFRYKSLINPFVKPINFRKKVLDTPEKYALTDKADGSRRLVFINSFGIYLIMPEKIIHTYKYRNEITHLKCIDTIFDAEWLGDSLLVFDVLVFCGQDQRNKSFQERWSIIRQYTSSSDELSSLNIHLKHFLFPDSGSFFLRTQQILEYACQQCYKNDGIIFNHIDEPYSSSTIYKWKPPEMLTIDFTLVKKDTCFDLFVKQDHSLSLLKFKGSAEFPHSGEYIPLNGDIIVEDGQLVEFIYTNNRFQPIRIRNDRDIPNTHWVSLSIWKDIQDPITLDTILGHDLYLMRRYHNSVKRNLLSIIGNGKLILDIGSGRGGDILKWKLYNFSVLVVEPNKNHLHELHTRLLQNGYSQMDSSTFSFDTSRIVTLHAKGQHTQLIQNTLQSSFNTSFVDAVVMFNSLTFFFDKQKSFTSLLDTIHSCLAPDGIFLGLVMEGSRVEHELMPIPIHKLKENYVYDLDTHTVVSDTNTTDTKFKHGKLISSHKYILDSYIDTLPHQIQESSWNMKVHDTWSNTSFGNSITIHLDDTIVDDQLEYLVSMDVLSSHMTKLGFLKTDSFWLENNLLSPTQFKLSRLYTSFVFKKSKDIVLLPEYKKIVDDDVLIGIIQEESESDTLFHALSRAIIKNYIGMTNLDIHTKLSLHMLKKRILYISKLKSRIQHNQSIFDLFKTEVILDGLLISSGIYKRCVYLTRQQNQLILIGKLFTDGEIQTCFPYSSSQ